MKFNKDLAAIHGYLCSDGYVIRNPPNQKMKYYHVGFRNTNLILLKDFKKKAEKLFCVNARFGKDGRIIINSKGLYFFLTEDFSYYSREWTLPKLDKECMKYWLRAFFDCEGWVMCKKAVNRHISADSVNKKGLAKIKEFLESYFGIKSLIRDRKGRSTATLSIYGKENIIKFRDSIGFLHNKKSKKLEEAIDSYVTWEWDFSKVNPLSKIRICGKRVRAYSSLKINIQKLHWLLDSYGIKSRVSNPIKNGLGNIYFELSVYKPYHQKLFKLLE